MNNKRKKSKRKKLYKALISNNNPKIFHLLTENNIKKQNNINSYFNFSLLKSKSIIPSSSNTSRNHQKVNLKNSIEDLLKIQKSQRNSKIKNNSVLSTLINQKNRSKTKSKTKRGISAKKGKISQKKNSSYLSNNDFIKNIILFRKKNQNKIINDKTNKSQSNNNYCDYNSNNNSRTRPRSIRYSLIYGNKISNNIRPERPTIKYDNMILKKYNIESYINKNKKNETIKKIKDNNKKNKKWFEIKSNLEDLKGKAMLLLNKYYFLSENLYNELENLNSNGEINIYSNNYNYDYRKKIFLSEKNSDYSNY